MLSGRINLSISYSALGIGIIVLLLIIGGIFFSGISIPFSDYLSLASAAFTGIGLLYTASSLKYVLQNSNHSEGKQKKEKAYKYAYEWTKPHMVRNSMVIQEAIKHYHTSSDLQLKHGTFVKYIETTSNILASVKAVLNYFETLSLLVSEDIIDEKSLKNAFKSSFDYYYQNLNSYISSRQILSPSVFNNYTILIEKWRKP